ncbi:MAG TPA: hypothetical protein VGV87_27335 [Blastocatellia bacterium]|nr:hypothetical protein [Blastocatellia bacterium]
MKKSKLWVLLLTILISSACKNAYSVECAGGEIKSKMLPPLDRSEDKPLPPMNVNGVTFRRTEQIVGGNKVVILHKTDQFFTTSSIQAKSLTNFLVGGGFVCTDASNPWCAPTALTTFNCHAFALGDRAGLSPQDWLDGEAGPLTDGINPMGALVSYYLKPYRKSGKTAHEITRLAGDRCVCEGDVICFLRMDESNRLTFVHSGKMVKVGSQNWVMSKLGENPVCTLPLRDLVDEYAPIFSWIELFK